MKKQLIFRNDEHERMFNQFCFQMKKLNSYHYAVAYLLALDDVVRKHVQHVFNFEEDVIILDALARPWQTATSQRITVLLFNLWNGYNGDFLCAPDEIFSCSYAPYYCEALALRFPCYFEEQENCEGFNAILDCSVKCPWFDGTTEGCCGCSRIPDCVMYEYLEGIENSLKPEDREALDRVAPEDDGLAVFEQIIKEQEDASCDGKCICCKLTDCENHPTNAENHELDVDAVEDSDDGFVEEEDLPF